MEQVASNSRLAMLEARSLRKDIEEDYECMDHSTIILILFTITIIIHKEMEGEYNNVVVVVVVVVDISSKRCAKGKSRCEIKRK